MEELQLLHLAKQAILLLMGERIRKKAGTVR
jgi:hypothetical protein